MSPTRRAAAEHQATKIRPQPLTTRRAPATALALATIAIAALAASAGRADAGPAAETSLLRVRVALPRSLQTAAPIVNVARADDPNETRTIVLTTTPVATFAGVHVGPVIVSVSVPGGARAEARLTVGAHEVVTLSATIAPDGAGSSQLEVIDRDRLSDSIVIDDRFLRDLPSTSHASALIETVAPFVVVDQMDNGGATTAQTTFMGSRGASFVSTAMVDGRRPLPDVGRVGLMPTTPDLDTIESVVVTHGTAPSDVATPGTLVTFVPRLPGPALRGAVRAAFTTSGMVATNALPDAPSIGRLEAWRDVGAEVGGPIRSNAGAFLAASTSRTRQRHRADPRVLSSNVTTVVGRAVLRTGRTTQLLVSAGGTRLSRPFDGRGQLASDDAEERVRQWQTGASWTRAGSNGTVLSLSASAERHAFTPAIDDPAGGIVDRVFDGVVPAPPASHRTRQWNAIGEIRAPGVGVGRTNHSLRLGADVRRGTVESTVIALPVVAETVAGLPARAWHPVAPARDASRGATQAAVFVEDRFDLTPALSGVAGVRVASASGSAAGAADRVRWQTVAPRATLRWRLGPVAAFGGVGRYASDLSLFLLAYGDPGAPWWRVHRWADPGGNGRLDEGETGVLVARVGPGAPVSSIDPDLDAPRTTEWTVGGEFEIGHHRLRGAIVIRRQHSLLGLLNAGVPRSGYDAISITDQNTDWHSPNDDHVIQIYSRRPESFGADRYVLTNPGEAEAEHDGIELAWEVRSTRWQMLFGATASRSIGRGAWQGFGVFENDHGIVGEQYANPNAAIAGPGRLFFDRAYVGKWAVSYRAPGDIRVGAVARYQDGQPFSRVIIADLSTGPEMIQAYSAGRTRFTYTATVDVRVEKGFRLADRRAALQLDLFNLTNHRNEVEEDVRTGETFRRSTAVQPPLTARLGVRVFF